MAGGCAGCVSLDPCSNLGAHIQADVSFMLSTGQDGLAEDWSGSVFCNPPYSNPLPWCQRLADHDGPWCALLKLDPSTRWWAALMSASPIVAPFRKRLKFEGSVAMTANFPSVLVYSAWRPSADLAAHLWLPEVRMTDREFELALAQRDAALDSLHDLLALAMRTGGYTTHEQQAVLRYAKALLVEAGRWGK